MCRGPCARPESLNHILQGCALTHGPRVKRHDSVVARVERALRRPGVEVLREPTIPHGSSFLKPDLLLVGEEEVVVLDIAIASDGHMRHAAEEKDNKYGRGSAASAILQAARALNPSVQRLRSAPIVFSSRGLLHPPTKTALRDLAPNDRRVLTDCVWLVVRGSLSTYHQYHRSTFIL